MNSKCHSDMKMKSLVNREMLDGAQRMIAELKADPSKKTKSGVDEARSREVRLIRHI